MSSDRREVVFEEVERETLWLGDAPRCAREASHVVWFDGRSTAGIFATGAPQQFADVATSVDTFARLGRPLSSLLMDTRRFGMDAALFAEMLRKLPSLDPVWRQIERCAVVLPDNWTVAWWRGVIELPALRDLVSFTVFTDPSSACASLGLTSELIEAVAALVARSDASPVEARVLDALSRDPRASVEDVARRLGVSTRALQRGIASAGGTFLDLRTKARVGIATSALARSDDKVESIASTVGFDSRSHFVAWFRRVTGQTPSAYRAGARGNVAAPSEEHDASR